MNGRNQILLFRLAAPVVSVLLALAAGAFFMFVAGYNPWQVYATLLTFSLGRADSIGSILFYATPLLFAGLAVAVAMKAGILNIGVEGQYLIGAFCAAGVGFSLHGLPGWLHLSLAVAAAMAGSLLWILLPAYLKLYRGVHEVISTILLNYVAFSLLHWLVAEVFMDRNQQIPAGLGSPLIRTPLFDAAVAAPKLHGLLGLLGLDVPEYIAVNLFLPLGILLAVGCWFIFRHTPLGYEITATGQGPLAARNVGIAVNRVRLKAFLLSGAIGGLVGLSHLFGYYDSFDLDFPRNFGFSGIAVALLANNQPLGVIPSALLFGLLQRGGEGIQTFLAVPMELVVVLQGIMILCVALTMRWLERLLLRRERGTGA